MIKHLEIKNFKSIKHLELDCKRINLFIGEPNVGKSNILESLGIFSWADTFEDLKSFCRFESIIDLFHDGDFKNSIEIRLDSMNLNINHESEGFVGNCFSGGVQLFFFKFDYDGRQHEVRRNVPPGRIHFYKFIKRTIFPKKRSDFLLPPSGENLFAVITVNKELKKMAGDFFSNFGQKLLFMLNKSKIEVTKIDEEDIVVSHPYSLSSDTLQRVIFFNTAIQSNKESALIFEEPESHSFPYHTKYLAEQIALDENNNQYFISTHNPYFLLSILEKSHMDEVIIFITYYKDYQTKVKPLGSEDIEEIMGQGIDAFFNIERFLGKNK